MAFPSPHPWAFPWCPLGPRRNGWMSSLSEEWKDLKIHRQWFRSLTAGNPHKATNDRKVCSPIPYCFNTFQQAPGAQDYNPSPLNSCASGSAPRSIAPVRGNYKYHCRALPGQLCMNGAPRQGNALGAAVFAQPGSYSRPDLT